MSRSNSSDLRVQRTQRWLQKALRELMQKKPYEKITIGDLSDCAEVSRQTFYLHYESKDDLLLSLFDDMFEGFWVEVNKELEQGYPGSQRMALLLFQQGEKNVESLRVLMDAGVDHLVQERIRGIFLESFSKARAAHSHLDGIDALLPYVTDFITGGTFMLLKRWIQEDMSVPSETLGVLLGEVGHAFQRVAEELSVEGR